MGRLEDKLYDSFGRKLISGKVRRNLQTLYPYEEKEKVLKRYYTEKLAKLLRIISAGIIIGILLGVNSMVSEDMAETVFLRGEYGEGNKIHRVTARRENGYSLLHELEVGERRYTRGELEELYQRILPVLEEFMLWKNAGLQNVTGDLRLPEQVEGYPFAIRWNSDSPQLLNREGKLGKVKKREQVKLTAELEYVPTPKAEEAEENIIKEFRREYSWELLVCPGEKTENEKWEENLETALRESDKRSLYEKEWKLPGEVDGENVVWSREKKPLGKVLFGMILISSLAVYFLKDVELEKQEKERRQQLLDHYSLLVSRLVIYMGAGMTVRGAWEKIACGPGEKEGVKVKKNYLHMEMRYSYRELQSGIPEIACYERFGRRCGLSAYMKLGTLLAQNIKKGNRILLQQLEEEAQRAMEERKHRIRRAGEEAGTKLLGPMLLMMTMVLLLIIVPVFSGFAL